jgi:hypothetical protein
MIAITMHNVKSYCWINPNLLLLDNPKILDHFEFSWEIARCGNGLVQRVRILKVLQLLFQPLCHSEFFEGAAETKFWVLSKNWKLPDTKRSPWSCFANFVCWPTFWYAACRCRSQAISAKKVPVLSVLSELLVLNQMKTYDLLYCNDPFLRV